MESFDEIDVAPELVEALADEGIERPTALQEAVIPILRRGNNLVLAAGPGSGVLVAWLVPVLGRLQEAELASSDAAAPTDEAGDAAPEAHPRVLALAASREAADQLAESASRVASSLGYAVAAIGSPWALPERAHILFGTPADVLAAIASNQLDPSGVRTLVVDQAQHLERLGALGDVERVIDYVSAEAHRIVSALPVTDAVADFVERHCKRALTWPTPDASIDEGRMPMRGGVRFRVTSDAKEPAALALADELLTGGGARHVLFYCRSDDGAADLGDYLTLHGFEAGAPGDTSVPVWLGVDAMPARNAAKAVEDVRAVSFDVPADPDTLDRRHGFSADGVVMVLGREVSHLRSLARRIGYEAVPLPPPARRKPGPLEQLRSSLERALENEDGAPYLTMLEPLFERFDSSEVAAAAVALLREGRSAAGPQPPVRPVEAEPAAGAAASTPAWAKLFISIGERDGLRPGDLVGAITGEAGVDGKQVGKIDIRESHSVVEVHDAVAQRVIKALNGTTLKGRAVRADFDRPRKGGGRPPGRTPGGRTPGGRPPRGSAPSRTPRTPRPRQG